MDTKSTTTLRDFSSEHLWQNASFVFSPPQQYKIFGQIHIMEVLETELRTLLLSKTNPKCLAQLYLLLDSVRALADSVEAEIEEETSDYNDNSDSDDDALDNDTRSKPSPDYDSDASFTEEENKKIRSPEHRAFLKKYSLKPK
jgi:hypothetical protein